MFISTFDTKKNFIMPTRNTPPQPSLVNQLTTIEGLESYLRGNNPYEGRSDISSSILPWKRTAEESNSRNRYDAASADYQNSIAQYIFELNYNSESAKMQRMRAAGLNPDLIGLESGSEAPTRDINTQEPVQDVTTADPSQEISQIATIVGGAFSTALSLAQGIQSVKGATLANDAQEISNLDKIVQQVSSFLGNEPTFVEWLHSDASNPKHEDFSSYIFPAKYGAQLFPNGRLGRQYANIAGYISDWFSTKAVGVNANNDFITAMSKYAGFGADNDAIIKTIGVLNSALNDFDRSRYRRGKTENNYYNDYFGTADGTKAGEAFNLDVGSKASLKSVEQSLNSPVQKISEKLYKDFQDGNWFSGVVLFIMRLGMNLTGGFSRQSTPNGNNTGFNLGF